MNKVETSLRQKVQELLKNKTVNLVIGYEKGSLPLKARPCFITENSDSHKLIWNSFCKNNLSFYLNEIFNENKGQNNNKSESPKVAIISKGCDARSVTGLITENQIPKENIIIIGMPCNGMVDKKKIDNLLSGDCAISCLKDEHEFLEIKTINGKIEKLHKQDIMTDACRECNYPSYEFADIQIGGEIKEISPSIDIKVNKFEMLSQKERWDFFKKELSRCIKCNACRQACPNCYCQVCFADQTNPRWIGKSNDISNIMLYHIGRIFHQAGRCVGCDACVQACPMSIDLRTFTQKIVKDVKDLYGYIPGITREKDPPLCNFDYKDNESFITEP